MFFSDLSKYSYYTSAQVDSVWNVGWLDKDHEFPKGVVDEQVIQALKSIICHCGKPNAHVNVIRGVHPCALCGRSDIVVTCDGLHQYLGTSEIWIPWNEGFFASPSMVLHYIEGHQYLPPAPYLKALRDFDLSAHYSGQQIYDDLMKRHVS